LHSHRHQSSARLASLGWALAALLLVSAALLAGRELLATGVAVTVTVDGYTETVRSARPDVQSLLADLGLTLRPEDRLSPPAVTPLREGVAVEIRRARPGVILADGAAHTLFSHAVSVEGLLQEASLRVAPQDEIWFDGRRVSITTTLASSAVNQAPPRFHLGRAWAGHEPQPVRVAIRRALPVTVVDGAPPYTIYTTADTIGEALLREQVTLYLGDRVQPELGSRVQAGLRVVIQRSKPVLIHVDRRTVRTRTRGETVGDTLVELGLVVTGSDRVSPPLAQRIGDNTQISIVRVLETVEVEREAIPFTAVLAPDDQLEIDLQRLDQQGEEGEYRRRYKVVLEDGVEVSRVLTDDWVAAQPITQEVAYGRKIVSRPLETPEGVVSYWRKTRMLATSYSAATAGVTPDAPWYGRTRLGWPMRKGIVAVDPTVIPLGSRVYVPGYGVGDAADTGSAIRSRRIDLGYDDDNLVLWYRWVDVYWLDPPPPSWQVRWVLPNWPRE
jgi:uncharacterized protein YabE (DUF348 family)